MHSVIVCGFGGSEGSPPFGSAAPSTRVVALPHGAATRAAVLASVVVVRVQARCVRCGAMNRILRRFPPETLQARRRKVLEALESSALVLPGASVRFSSRDTEYPFRADSELFYLTGVDEPDAVAVLRSHADEERFILFVRPRDEKAELWTGPRMGPEAAKDYYGADEAYSLGELETRLPALLEGSRLVYYRLGHADRVEPLVMAALRRGRARGPRTGAGPRGVVDPGEILDDMRLIKDEEEIVRLREAATIAVDGFRAAMGVARPGMGEWELEAILNSAFRRAGAEGSAYPTIVASGGNACILHYVGNTRRMHEGEAVLVDAGAAVALYCSDVTRTFPADGRFTPAQRSVYEVVDAARAEAVAAVCPGATIADVHEAATRTLVEGLVALGVLEGDIGRLIEEKKHERYYPHQTSHWLGLDVHDVGDYARQGSPRVLESGMVLTVEPGLYFPAADDGTPAELRGLGVRIEDDVRVTEKGADVLTAALPTRADEIEALIGGGE